MVEDNPGDIVLTQRLLHTAAPGEFVLTVAHSLEEAIRCLADKTFDVVLLDLTLPDSVGLETLRIVLQEAPDLPIVILSGLDDRDMAIRAVREGAQEFIVKSGLNMRQAALALHSAMLRKETELVLAKRAFYDDLTGLPTRALLQDRWDRARARQARSGSLMGVLLLDLDEFKSVNDSFGHVAGDHVLVTVACRIEGALRRGDTLARLGGDEFAVLLEDVCGVNDIGLVARRIGNALKDAIEFDDTKIQAGASIGSAICHPYQNERLYDAIQRADSDMYRMKRARAGMAVTSKKEQRGEWSGLTDAQ